MVLKISCPMCVTDCVRSRATGSASRIVVLGDRGTVVPLSAVSTKMLIGRHAKLKKIGWNYNTNNSHKIKNFKKFSY
jgi:hypothetical protein